MPRYLEYVIYLLVFSIFALAVVGGVLNFSPVPHWDMWGGYLHFGSHAGEFHRWFLQHNEHRIVLSRLLFVIDIYLFKGSIHFLIVMNYLLALCGFLIFAKYYASVYGQYGDDSGPNMADKKISICVIWSLIFSWTQKENFTWGFQSQFFLAQIIPLLAFYNLSKSNLNDIRYYATGVIFGCLALGTMANGVMVLPLLFVMSILLGFNWKKVIPLAAIAALGNVLYFWGYNTPVHHGLLLDTIWSQPTALLQFILKYLGSPFYYYTCSLTPVIPLLFGGLFIISFIVVLIQEGKGKFSHPVKLGLIMFIIYIGGTAFGTAGSRALFGTDYAMSSRYTTPAIYAWIALLIIYASILAKYRNLFYGLSIILIIISHHYQLTAIEDTRGMNFNKMVAALCIKMRVKDESAMRVTWPNPKEPWWLISSAAKANYSIFNHRLLREAGDHIGQIFQGKVVERVSGWVDIKSCIEDDGYFKIMGWIFNKRTGSVPEKLLVFDTEKMIIGYGITGRERPDVAKLHGPGAKYSGFVAYLKSGYGDQRIYIAGTDSGGVMKTNLKRISWINCR